jgi:hypothetical protein
MEAAMAEDYSDDDINLAIRDTEKEVFWSAVTGDDDGGDTNNQMVEDLSQAESWDGDDLPIEEIAHRTMQGDIGTNFDRPIAMETEVSLANQNAALREQNARLTNAYNEHVGAPQREAQIAAQREAARQHVQDKYGLYDLSYDEPHKFDAFVRNEIEKQQLLHAAGADRINRSFAEAHHKYGDEFVERYNAFTSQPVDAISQAMARRFTEAEDPGEAFMALMDNPFSRPPPFMPASSPYRYLGPSPRQSRARAPRDGMGGWGDAAVEEDIFNSAFDDEGW